MTSSEAGSWDKKIARLLRGYRRIVFASRFTAVAMAFTVFILIDVLLAVVWDSEFISGENLVGSAITGVLAGLFQYELYRKGIMKI